MAYTGIPRDSSRVTFDRGSVPFGCTFRTLFCVSHSLPPRSEARENAGVSFFFFRMQRVAKTSRLSRSNNFGVKYLRERRKKVYFDVGDWSENTSSFACRVARLRFDIIFKRFALPNCNGYPSWMNLKN